MTKQGNNKADNKTSKEKEVKEKDKEKSIELESIQPEVPLAKNQKLKQDLLSATSITIQDRNDDVISPRRDFSDVITSPREVGNILKRKNTFPKAAYHEEEKRPEWKDDKDNIFVEPPVPTVSSFAIGLAVNLPNPTLTNNSSNSSSGKETKPKLEIKVPSLKSIPWCGLITNMGTISMYNLYVLIFIYIYLYLCIVMLLIVAVIGVYTH